MSRRGAAVFQLTPSEPLEHELQITCTNMLHRVLLPDVCWTAIDHAHTFDTRIGRYGRPVGLLEAQKRVARGIKPGIPDYAFWHQARAFAIELKKDADGRLSDHQEDFLTRMIAAGAEVSICWSTTQVLNKVQEWGLARRVRVMA